MLVGYNMVGILYWADSHMFLATLLPKLHVHPTNVLQSSLPACTCTLASLPLVWYSCVIYKPSTTEIASGI